MTSEIKVIEKNKKYIARNIIVDEIVAKEKKTKQ